MNRRGLILAAAFVAAKKRFSQALCLFRPILLLIAISAASPPAFAAQGWEAASAGVALFDAPSARARALFLLVAGYPLRGLSSIDRWEKVETPDGDILWARREDVQAAQAVVVKADIAAVRERPDASSPPVFAVRRGVVLRALADATGGGEAWLKIAHQDGEVGFVRAALVWRNY
jgi:SH3-like domain-containing protein